jgi:integrase
MKVTTYKPDNRPSWYFHLHGTEVPTPSHQLRRGGFASQREAQRAGREVARALERGEYVPDSTETVAGFLALWMQTKRPSLKATSAASYEQVIRLRIVPHLGEVRLAVLEREPERVAQFYGVLLASGRQDGRGGLNPKTVRNVAGVLHEALDDAVKWGRCLRNPSDAVDLPRWERPEITTWTSAEMAQFLAATESTRLGLAWRVLLTTGCRRGELAGLRWRAIDFRRRTMAITLTRVRAGAVTVIDTPKTKSSRRVIALDDVTVAALRQRQRDQGAERLAAGPAWHGPADRLDDYVVADEIGRPLPPGTISRWWSKEVERVGLPLIRLHDARHTHATVALLEGGQRDEVVSARLGHSSVATTLRLYAHVKERDDRRAADAVAALIAQHGYPNGYSPANVDGV